MASENENAESSNTEVVDHGVLIPKLFPGFEKLLTECAAYGKLSGGRFRARDFDPVRLGDGTMPHLVRDVDAQVRKAALPMVQEYQQKIKDDQDLRGECEYAQRLVVKEGIQNAMRETCVQLHLWRADPSGDIGFQDMSQPLPVIAGKLYNYVKLRDTAEHQRRILTANFLSDFWMQSGMKKCDCTSEETMLTEFLARVDEWGKRTNAPKYKSVVRNVMENFLDDKTLKSVESWWKENKKGVAIAAGVALGAILLAGIGRVASKLSRNR